MDHTKLKKNIHKNVLSKLCLFYYAPTVSLDDAVITNRCQSQTRNLKLESKFFLYTNNINVNLNDGHF